MNKKLFLILMIFSLTLAELNAQENTQKWSQQVDASVGFYHLGAYAKENPSLFLEYQANYRVLKKINIGLGAGVNLYPAALAYPLYVEAQYRFSIGDLPAYTSQSYGVNLKLGERSFFSHRNVGNLNVILFQDKNVQLISGLGYLFLWDNYGGKNISFLFNVGIEI